MGLFLGRTGMVNKADKVSVGVATSWVTPGYDDLPRTLVIILRCYV